MTNIKNLLAVLLYFSAQLSWAEELPLDASATDLPKISVEGESRSVPLGDSIFKTEKLSGKKLKEARSSSIAEAVSNQVGLDTQTYCANCGAKRLTINGLKGEHTSILIDGLPLYSSVSSFYGIDAIPVNGLEEVQVMRGSGASLVNPEAIGGTINLITIDPLEDLKNYSLSYGSNQSQNHSLLLSTTSLSGRYGLSVGGHYSLQDFWDEDDNSIAESPRRESWSGLVKMRAKLSDKDDLSLRYSHADLNILGGHVSGFKHSDIPTQEAVPSDFVNGDVRNRFTGSPERVSDYVKVKRDEVSTDWTHYIDQLWTLRLNAGYSRQEQQAIYMHGFDYANVDQIYVTDVSTQWVKGDHLFNLGVFYKSEQLRSESLRLFRSTSDGGLGLPRDNFDFKSVAIYLQDTLTVNSQLEVDLSVRADQIDLDWTDLDNEVNESLAAPRLQIKHSFNDHLTQRLSYGLGYRAPLSFFESQHGSSETGYEVDITRLEKAHSLVYSISQNTPDYYVTFGSHFTRLYHMAYGEDVQSQPIRYKNTDEKYNIWVNDLLVGKRILPWWFIEMSFEAFDYEAGYKQKLPTAAIEERIQLNSEMTSARWTHNLNVSYVGPRDISEYGGYRNHYNRRQFDGGGGESVSEPKRQAAPGFFTMDTSASYSFSEALKLTAGIYNIFDYTQSSANDTPSTWHLHYDHAHFDNFHTWGPNRGREFYLQMSGEF